MLSKSEKRYLREDKLKNGKEINQAYQYMLKSRIRAKLEMVKEDIHIILLSNIAENFRRELRELKEMLSYDSVKIIQGKL